MMSWGRMKKHRHPKEERRKSSPPNGAGAEAAPRQGADQAPPPKRREGSGCTTTQKGCGKWMQQGLEEVGGPLVLQLLVQFFWEGGGGK